MRLKRNNSWRKMRIHNITWDENFSVRKRPNVVAAVYNGYNVIGCVHL